MRINIPWSFFANLLVVRIPVGGLAVPAAVSDQSAAAALFQLGRLAYPLAVIAGRKKVEQQNPVTIGIDLESHDSHLVHLERKQQTYLSLNNFTRLRRNSKIDFESEFYLKNGYRSNWSALNRLAENGWQAPNVKVRFFKMILSKEVNHVRVFGADKIFTAQSASGNNKANHFIYQTHENLPDVVSWPNNSDRSPHNAPHFASQGVDETVSTF